uniref:Intraflagellar transport protein 46 homolog n=1 Tax=Trichuris muris TaxID=70415 RepID=A0A5S6QUW6_TRIMR
MDTDSKLKFIVKREDSNMAIDQWIEEVTNKYLTKQSSKFSYRIENMPDMDSLMQEWPAEFEQLLSGTKLPSPTDDITVDEYIGLICSLLDIPVNESRIDSLYVLFLLYSQFKNSQHFKAMKNGKDFGQSTTSQDMRRTDTLIL